MGFEYSNEVNTFIMLAFLRNTAWSANSKSFIHIAEVAKEKKSDSSLIDEFYQKFNISFLKNLLRCMD